MLLAALDYSSLYKLCEHLDIPAIQSLLSSSSPSTRTFLFSYQNKYGWTPLYRACVYGHLQIVEMLLVAGTNKETPNKHGCTPLHVACKAGHDRVVLMLLSAGANKETPNNDGKTPLWFASLSLLSKSDHWSLKIIINPLIRFRSGKRFWSASSGS